MKKGLPVIYLSKNDNSLLDQLLIQLTLFLNRFTLPFPFIEKSLIDNHFFNKFLRFMGIKFVNNCLLAPGNQDEDSTFYQETLRAYLVECLKAGNGLNVKLDSHILDCIVDLTQKEAIYDALIVPVDVSHEQPVARVTSVRTGLVAFFKALFLGPLFGQVRVNFGQAFSLKEYLDVTETKNAYRFKRQFSASTSLKRHIAYDIFQINAIMCTDMVAFILVTHFPQVKQPRLLIRTKISSFF